MTRKFIKKLYILFFITLVMLMLSSCKKSSKSYISNSIAIVYKDNKPYIINKENELYDLSYYDSVIPKFDTTLIVKKDNLFGYIKNSGEPITKTIYNEAYPFSENKAVVSIDEKYHIINEQGNIIYSFDDGIISYSYFKENKLVIIKDDKQGYLKYNEETNQFTYLIESENVDDNFIYDYCGQFENGFAVIGNLNDSQQLKYTHINAEGAKLYNLEWDYANNFSEGYAVVGNNEDYQAKVYISSKNRFDRNNRTSTTNMMVYRYVDKNGNYLENEGNPLLLAMAHDFKDGIALIANLYVYSEDESSEDEKGTIDFSTNRYFYNYDFINLNGNNIFENPGYELVNQNNFGGNIIIYDDLFILDDYYIATYFKTNWFTQYSTKENYEPTAPFDSILYDLEDYKKYKTNDEKNEYLQTNYPWINEYLDSFTIGNQTAIYAADKFIHPFTMSNYKQSIFFDNALVAKVQITSGMKDSCGIIKVSIIDDTPKISYIIPPLYEEIIF